MTSFCEKIIIGSQFLLGLFGFLIISMSLGGTFYAYVSQEDIINGNIFNINYFMFKLIPTGALIFVIILLLWFGISYIIGAVYTKIKKDNFFKGGKNNDSRRHFCSYIRWDLCNRIYYSFNL